MLTIGHSNLPLEEFLRMLAAHEVQQLVDVRSAPYSRHNPQFNRETLADALRAAGIQYRHMPGLGGLRRPKPDSPNMGWRNPHFRGYADYMQTAEFEKNLDELLQLQAQSRTVIMCAEAVPWRCHRSLIADAVTARGIEVRDIFSTAKATPHRMTAFARVDGDTVHYPAETLDLFTDR